ncbi:MAG: BREX-4 system phosphatase PglZ [Eubacterium sp.]|nr:BREX-4 system phosphatase PglZ [Eubacterium sp.]
MYCKDVHTCFAELEAYCNGEKTGHVLLVNTENYSIYHQIFARLQADVTKKCILVSEHCSQNGLPNIDDICSMITGDGCYVLAGISQVAMLRSARTLHHIIGKLLELPVRGYAIALLDHSAFHIKEYMAKNLKVERRVVLIDGNASVFPRIHLARSQKECIGIEPLPDMKHLFSYLENLKETDYVQDITVMSTFSPAVFSDSMYSVSICDNIYISLTKVYSDLASGTDENYGTDEQWRRLSTELKKAGSFSAVLKNLFGESANFAFHLGKIANSGDSFQMWLLWLSMKVFGTSGNGYLAYVMENSHSVDDFENHLYMDLLKISVSDSIFDRYYSERKRLIDDMPENLSFIDLYCSMVGKHERNAVYYLTDFSDKEKYEFLHCLSIYDYGEEELMQITSSNFRSLYLYMQPFVFTSANTRLSDKDASLRSKFSDYFRKYKIQKLTNRVWPEFLELVESYAEIRPYNRLQARSSIVNKLPRNNTQLFFFDALGVEFLSYIMAKCDEYGMVAELSIGYSFLPTITEKNKEFMQYFPSGVLKIDDLDELKHHSQVIDYRKCKEPVHLFQELEIIDKQLRQIQSQLVQRIFETAIIVSDHGASRLAVIHNEENPSSLTLDEKAEHSGRCCLAEEDPHIPFAAYENGFSVLANYSRFKGGRRANVEVHGGGTLEEVLVPVITLSRKPDNIEICFVDPVVELHGKETAAITLFSNIPLQQPRLLVNSQFYEGVFVGDQKHTKFEMPELKRSRNCVADIYDGDKKLVSELPFRVQRNMGRDILHL